MQKEQKRDIPKLICVFLVFEGIATFSASVGVAFGWEVGAGLFGILTGFVGAGALVFEALYVLARAALGRKK